MNLHKLSFKARIFLGYLIVIIMMIVLVISNLMNYRHTEQNLTEIKNAYLPPLWLASMVPLLLKMLIFKR